MKIAKGKITVTVTILIACFALTLVMFMQFKIVNQTDLDLIETMRETELQEELANWKEMYDKTEEKYKETLVTIEEYRTNTESNEETEKLLEKELEEINMALGTTNVQGSGIEIVLNNVDSYEVPKINSYDLLLIVNSLKLAGAEAISINDQRIINTTDIVDIQFDYDSFIKINGERILAPYNIKAIGDSRYLESELLGTGGHVNRMQKIGHNAVINRMDLVNILKYNKDISTDYIGK